MHTEYDPTIVDWEIFMLKIICIKSFCVDKFLRFVKIFFFTVYDYIMDKHLECS